VDNRDPRSWLAQQEEFRKRANAAQLNSLEAFPLFAAAVITAHVLNDAPPLVDMLALVFIAAHVLYLACYLADLSTLRSLVWFVGSFLRDDRGRCRKLTIYDPGRRTFSESRRSQYRPSTSS